MQGLSATCQSGHGRGDFVFRRVWDRRDDFTEQQNSPG
jgi:hypothetical protein